MQHAKGSWGQLGCAAREGQLGAAGLCSTRIAEGSWAVQHANVKGSWGQLGCAARECEGKLGAAGLCSTRM